MKGAPNCYECKHRRDLPGDSHSACAHPAFADANNSFAKVLATFASVGRLAPVNVRAEGCNVVGHPHGIRMGWFNHPFNFDPTWLQSCTGFEPKKDAA
jgi:hypothetical protein